jgi:2-polyprenyl-3-methyl-5-hydroxy-6-metoxy-1,4-benzoquinol methylase
MLIQEKINKKCKICNDKSEYCFSALILRKYDIPYHKCINCGFIQINEPFWLDEAYTDAIANQDIGLISRNLTIAPILSSLIKFSFDKNGRFLDYGGGYGMLTRMMRDKGYDYYRFDTFCENVFAKHFDVHAPSSQPDYELVTAFEVFEHLSDPLSELENILEYGKSVFFSTELQPAKLQTVTDWWYIVPETGQHIAFYTIKSLRLLAAKFSLNFYTNGFNLHLFTKKKINPWVFGLLMKYHTAKIIDVIPSKTESLLMKDYQIMKEKKS